MQALNAVQDLNGATRRRKALLLGLPEKKLPPPTPVAPAPPAPLVSPRQLDERLREMWLAGIHGHVIAQKIDVDVSEVWRRARALDLPRRQGGYDDVLREMWSQGLSISEIAHRVRRTGEAVRARARRIGLPERLTPPPKWTHAARMELKRLFEADRSMALIAQDINQRLGMA
ncbi:MAG: hypothetical protein ACRCZI_03450, partial [Cetobacterium sp.]